MRIAIIGGLGFIGRELSRVAIEAGHELDIYDLAESAPPRQSGVTYTRIDFSGDLIEKKCRADALVLLAAKRSFAGFSYDDYEKNVAIANKCFQWAKACNISNIVFASSKAVYSNQETIPWTEDMYTNPQSLYGASKVAVEQIASLWNAREGMQIKSLRFAQVIGMGERKGFLINTLIDNAINKTQQTIFGTGDQRRQYIYVKDVCHAILAALEHAEIGGVFNIGMPGSISNLELAECVNRVFDNEGNLIHDLSKHMDEFCDEMSVEKAKQVLGWNVQYDLKELFEDIKRIELT